MRRGLLPLSSALLTALGGAAASGMLSPDAAAQISARRDDDERPPLLVALSDRQPGTRHARGHGSHRSHSSHRSHYSGAGGGGNSGGDTYVAPAPAPEPPPPPPPPPPKPARVSFVAYPGGQISIDGRVVGRDVTEVMSLKAGTHEVTVENRFIGTHKKTIQVADGETGTITIEW